MWSAVQARLCSDALQEARRAELEQEREKEREELRKAKVRPDCVVLLCRRAYVPDALQALRVEQERDALWAANQVHFEEYRQKEEKRTQEEVRPDCVVCCAS